MFDLVPLGSDAMLEQMEYADAAMRKIIKSKYTKQIRNCSHSGLGSRTFLKSLSCKNIETH